MVRGPPASKSMLVFVLKYRFPIPIKIKNFFNSHNLKINKIKHRFQGLVSEGYPSGVHLLATGKLHSVSAKVYRGQVLEKVTGKTRIWFSHASLPCQSSESSTKRPELGIS